MDDFPRKMGISDWEFRLIPGTTKIEYDKNKESLNLKKHGYSLERAVSILERIAFPVGEPLPYRCSDGFLEGGEVRHNHMSVDESGKVVFMVTTMRTHESVRIISFRRAKKSERERFFRQTGFRERT